jgi:signal transduction histidine kinase
MNEMIDGLLGLSKLGVQSLEPVAVDLSSLAEEALADLAEADPERRFSSNIEAGLTAVVDRVLIRQVLDNLLGNAWKYSRDTDEARIAFYAETDPADGCRFVVSDNGSGFDVDDTDTLFKVFSRGHGADEFVGTGIGLSTVKRIIERHGGRVGASGRVGEGAKFWFSLGGHPS